MLFKFFRQPAIDPLQVSMTGVKMGEKFLLLGCDDPVLLAGLGAKVGLQRGGAAVVTFDEHQAVAAKRAADREGFRRVADGARWRDRVRRGAVRHGRGGRHPGGFAARDRRLRHDVPTQAHRVLRRGGRLEVVEGLGGGPLAKATVRPAGATTPALERAAFKPVRVLAEVTETSVSSRSSSSIATPR
ncbi:MAG: hypothetical protein U0P30_16730 [Vicinamibacterales bacterium]